MEELINIIIKENIKLNYIDVPTDYHDGTMSEKFIKELRNFIK